MKRLLWILFLFVIATAAVEAANCPIMYARNTQDLLNEIPSLDTQLQGCPVPLPSGLSWVIGGDVLVEISMTAGGTEYVTVDVHNKQIVGVDTGKLACKQQVRIKESDLDLALASRSRSGALIYLFVNKAITLKGCTVWQSFKGWFIKPIGRSIAKKAGPTTMPASVASGKPDNCDETWLPGHQGYAQNKALWDSYSADTDGVCQSQYGKGIPSPCAHSVQLSVSGNPYYLCWYNV